MSHFLYPVFFVTVVKKNKSSPVYIAGATAIPNVFDIEK
jgi:hypothetical protein